MPGRDNNGGSAGRGVPLRVVLLAMTVAASLPAFVATVVSAHDAGAQPAAAQPAAGTAHFNTNRQEIGRGDSALGPYIMYTSTGPEGICAQVELPETSPPGARAFYSDCSRERDPPVN